MSNRLLVGCALVSAAGALVSILTFFGITSNAFKGSTGLAVLAVLLALGSVACLYFLRSHPIAPATPSTSANTPSISATPIPSSSPSVSSPTPVGVVPVATDSAPIILNRENPIASVRVGVGDYKEFLCEGITVRISVEGLVTDDPKQPLAILKVSSGGMLVYGGDKTQRVGTNHYRVPVTKSDYDEPDCVYFYNVQEDGKFFRFFCANVTHINLHAGQVTVDVFSFRHTQSL
jgi:hypothetical protein